ncbi:hypothetical protein N0O92_09150 [Alkalihalobacillus sp. MEB130]|uniref:hypothetical protein n=1 Tax=Alkalihalobacillus sp. MEB130 TaxID=2976704 RepID=UPI0028DD50F7|nr:hypothetical protein [Alkalihalobacillus sp. MEB130]MDT8860400.1 hypothetical protein [Alkalihalobacillus sp. MEB130]
MKRFLFIAFILASIIVIFISHTHYDQKLATIADEAEDMKVEASPATIEEESASVESFINTLELGGLLEEVVDQNKDDEILVMVFGSSAITSVEEKESMPHMLLPYLQTLLPDQNIALTVMDVKDATSSDVLADNYIDKVIRNKPDLLVMEPLLFNDFDKVDLDESLDHLETIMADLTEKLPDTTIVLSPANPIDDEKYVALVDQVKSFSKDQNYFFADRWEEKIKKSDQSLFTNEKLLTEVGHLIWTEFLIEYFVK